MQPWLMMSVYCLWFPLCCSSLLYKRARKHAERHPTVENSTNRSNKSNNHLKLEENHDTNVWNDCFWFPWDPFARVCKDKYVCFSEGSKASS